MEEDKTDADAGVQAGHPVIALNAPLQLWGAVHHDQSWAGSFPHSITSIQRVRWQRHQIAVDYLHNQHSHLAYRRTGLHRHNALG